MDDGTRGTRDTRDALPIDAATARRFLAERRALVQERLDAVEARLVGIRTARGEWTDEEHDPEGFALTFEWQQSEGSRAEHRAELLELERAESRVESGAYGTCETCGHPIPEGQLERRPARTACVACTDRRR